MMLPLIGALALAAPSVDTRPSALIDAVDACRQIADGPARLACFDRTTAAVADARTKRELLVTDRGQVRTARRGLFGFTLSSFKLFGGSDKDDAEDDIKQIDVKLASVGAFGYGLYSLTLTDGAVWQTTEENRGFVPRAGDTVTIKRSAFGYMVKSGYSLTRIHRVK